MTAASLTLDDPPSGTRTLHLAGAMTVASIGGVAPDLAALTPDGRDLTIDPRRGRPDRHDGGVAGPQAAARLGEGRPGGDPRPCLARRAAADRPGRGERQARRPPAAARQPRARAAQHDRRRGRPVDQHARRIPRVPRPDDGRPIPDGGRAPPAAVERRHPPDGGRRRQRARHRRAAAVPRRRRRRAAGRGPAPAVRRRGVRRQPDRPLGRARARYPADRDHGRRAVGIGVRRADRLDETQRGSRRDEFDRHVADRGPSSYRASSPRSS